MRTSMCVKHFVAPALLTLAALGLGTGCSSAKNALNGSCGSGEAGTSLVAKLDAFKQAADALSSVQASITSKVALACVNITKALDPSATVPTVTDGTVVSASDTDTACKAASNAIATAKGSGSITVTYSAPACTVNAEAQVKCQADCNVSASCTPPDIKASCTGHLSGTCSGTCQGTCTAEVTAAAECSGTCNGTCEGTCNGKTGTAGNGVACNGTCSAGCKGTCEATASADVQCKGSCSGGCSVDYEAPKCDVQTTPPSCSAAADCNAGCDSSASLTATCTKPSVTIDVTGGASADLKTALEANLPVILQVAAQGELAGTAVADLGSKALDVASAFTAEVGCAVKYGADFATKLSASVEASANVSMSFKASADVSASASAS